MTFTRALTGKLPETGEDADVEATTAAKTGPVRTHRLCAFERQSGRLDL